MAPENDLHPETDSAPATLVESALALRHQLEAMRAAGIEHIFTESGPLAETIAAQSRTRPSSNRPATNPPGQAPRHIPGMEVRQPLGSAPQPPSRQEPPDRPPESPPMPRRAAPGPSRNGQPVIVPSVAAGQLEGMAGRRAKLLAAMAHDVAKCAACRLCTTRTMTVFSRGNPNSPLMFIGEAPGADEDMQGLPFVGRAGKLLDDILSKGMKYQPEDVFIANVLKCRPPDNRNPMPDEIEACRDFLSRQIEIVDPMVIIALGRFPAQWLLDSQEPIGKLRGKLWDVAGRKVLCTYHPAYLLRNPSAKADVWKDVQIVMDYFGRGKPLPMRTD